MRRTKNPSFSFRIRIRKQKRAKWFRINFYFIYNGMESKRETGKVAEWLIAPILKIGVALRSPGVRIPPFPIKKE